MQVDIRRRIGEDGGNIIKLRSEGAALSISLPTIPNSS